MAYEIIGTVHKVGTTENIQTRSGSAFQRRSITLVQRRFDQSTGQEFEPNFPTIDFTRDKCMELDKYKPGDKVRVHFDVSGVKYLDRNTNEEKYFTTLRGFRIEPYVQPNAQPQHSQQPQNYAPAGQWQQPAPQPQGYAQQPQAPYSPQGGGYLQAPPPQSQENDMPF